METCMKMLPSNYGCMQSPMLPSFIWDQGRIALPLKAITLEERAFESIFEWCALALSTIHPRMDVYLIRHRILLLFYGSVIATRIRIQDFCIWDAILGGRL